MRRVPWLIFLWVFLAGSVAAARPQSSLKARAKEVYRQGRFPEACELFARVVKDDHFDAWGWNDLALCRVKAGQYDQVLEPLEHAEALEKASPDEQLHNAMQTNLNLLAKALVQPRKEPTSVQMSTVLAVSEHSIEPQLAGALLELVAATQPEMLSEENWGRLGMWRFSSGSKDPIEALLQAGNHVPFEAAELPSVLPSGEGASWKKRCVPLVPRGAPCSGRWLACSPAPEPQTSDDSTSWVRRRVTVIEASSIDRWTVEPTTMWGALDEERDSGCGTTTRVLRIDACARRALKLDLRGEGCGDRRSTVAWESFETTAPTLNLARETKQAQARRALFEQALRTEEAVFGAFDWNELAGLRLEFGDQSGAIEALRRAGEEASPTVLDKLPHLAPVTACTNLDSASEAKCGRTWLRCPATASTEVVIDAHARKFPTTVSLLQLQHNQFRRPEASLLRSDAWYDQKPDAIIRVDVCAGKVLAHRHIESEERKFERLVEEPLVPLPPDLELIREFSNYQLLGALPEADRARLTEVEWLMLGCVLLDTHRDEALALFRSRLKPGAPGVSCRRLTQKSAFELPPSESTDWKSRCVPLDGAACGRRWVACHGKPSPESWSGHDVVVLEATTLDAWKTEPTVQSMGTGTAWFREDPGERSVFALDVCAGKALETTSGGIAWREFGPLAPPTW